MPAAIGEEQGIAAPGVGLGRAGYLGFQRSGFDDGIGDRLTGFVLHYSGQDIRRRPDLG